MYTGYPTNRCLRGRTMTRFTDGQHVTITRGPKMGYRGRILSRWVDTYRVALEANTDVVNVPWTWLKPARS